MDITTPRTVERYHWLNTITGILDAAFHLTPEEEFHVIDIVRKLLVGLRIPERSVAEQLPAAVSLEVDCGYYTTLLSAHRNVGFVRPIRAVLPAEQQVSVESWRTAFMQMITSSYPALDLTERLLLSKTLTDLLVALGVPNRAASFFPDDVVRAYQDNG